MHLFHKTMNFKTWITRRRGAYYLISSYSKMIIFKMKEAATKRNFIFHTNKDLRARYDNANKR